MNRFPLARHTKRDALAGDPPLNGGDKNMKSKKPISETAGG
jgi:hypothetical protein